jgi:tRNA(adenine34) deaminase
MNDERYMEKALEEARGALGMGEFPVGCVMVYEDKVLVTGARQHSMPQSQNELDHAEMLALRRLIDLGERIDRAKVTLFSTLEPCLMCYAALIVNGIRDIVYAYEDVLGGGTGVDLSSLNPFYKDMEVSIVSGVLRYESMLLFKQFFSDPRHEYLRDSLLAQHAMSQP